MNLHLDEIFAIVISSLEYAREVMKNIVMPYFQIGKRVMKN